MKTAFVVGVSLVGLAMAKQLQMKDLPAAVQRTVQENLKGGEIKSISKEKEKGVIQYEVATMVNGKHRDFNVDGTGGLVVVEEEVDLASVPAPARATIEKKIAGGKLRMVEMVHKGSVVSYEAAYTSKGGRKGEILVTAEGVEAHD
jgi:uncharacterized protein YpmB